LTEGRVGLTKKGLPHGKPFYNIVLNQTKQLQPTFRLVNSMMAVLFLFKIHFSIYMFAIIIIKSYPAKTLTIKIKLVTKN